MSPTRSSRKKIGPGDVTDITAAAAKVETAKKGSAQREAVISKLRFKTLPEGVAGVNPRSEAGVAELRRGSDMKEKAHPFTRSASRA